MDPNATLQLIDEAARAFDADIADQASADLAEWLEKGGCAPDWARWRVGHYWYQRAECRAKDNTKRETK